jgi:hypothetical protein
MIGCLLSDNIFETGVRSNFALDKLLQINNINLYHKGMGNLNPLHYVAAGQTLTPGLKSLAVCYYGAQPSVQCLSYDTQLVKVYKIRLEVKHVINVVLYIHSIKCFAEGPAFFF